MIVTETGSDFKPIDPGTYTAVCSRVIDQGTQTSAFYGTSKRKVLLAWEIPEVEVEVDGDKRPALVMSSYTASLSEKATLRKDLESWRGRKFTKEELEGFDLKNILGKGCMISVVHSEDGKYANVASVMALPRGMPAPPAPRELINFDLNAFDQDTFDKLSDKMREKIRSSPEFKALTGGFDPEQAGPTKTFQHDDIDDEIPF